jgi:hypothetical protein
MLVCADAAYVEYGYAVNSRRVYECISVPGDCGEWCGAVLCCAAIGMPAFQKLHVTSVSARTHLKHRDSRKLRLLFWDDSRPSLPHVQNWDAATAGTMDACCRRLGGAGPGALLSAHAHSTTTVQCFASVSSDPTAAVPSLRRRNCCDGSRGESVS